MSNDLYEKKSQINFSYDAHLAEVLVSDIFRNLLSANVTNESPTADKAMRIHLQRINIATHIVDTHLQVILLQPSVFIKGLRHIGLGHFRITAFVIASSTLFLPLVSCFVSTSSQRMPGWDSSPHSRQDLKLHCGQWKVETDSSAKAM
jgi:hypothetical protein